MKLKNTELDYFFKIDWILKNELAVGKAPRNDFHIESLKKENIVSVFSLCSEDEAPPPKDIERNFTTRRLVLPDHKYTEALSYEKLDQALNILSELLSIGSVFVHCVASVERSPLICMGWLVRYHKLTPCQALDYLMDIHPGTNPLSSQFNLLKKLKP